MMMMMMRPRLLSVLAIALMAPLSLEAAPLDLGRYEYDSSKEVGAAVGRRFLDDVKAQNPRLHAAVVDAVRYDIQVDEAAKFARQSKYVIAAYAVLFVILVGFVVALWLRSGKLNTELDVLEARLRNQARAQAGAS